MEIIWEGKKVKYVEVTRLEKGNERIKLKDEILNLKINAEEERERKGRKRYKPSDDHPWRKAWKWNVTFSRSNKM